MRPTKKTLGLGLILLAVFCGSFLFFYKRSQKAPPSQDLIFTPAVINQPLPKTHLVNFSGEAFDDESLRRGKVVLVFMMPDCEFCEREDEFLQTVGHRREGVSFVYVIPFGGKQKGLEMARGKYSLDPFYDYGSNLSKKLELYRVPVKVYLEDGIIKRVWPRATLDSKAQAEFKDWLNGV
jgi:hypothetical protein